MPKAIAVPITVLALAVSAQSDEQFRLTAAPQPTKTSTIVPIISAKYFFIMHYLLMVLNRPQM